MGIGMCERSQQHCAICPGRFQNHGLARDGEQPATKPYPMNSAPMLFIRSVLARDWQFLAVTLVSCAVAAIVATFQYSVYTSFVRTGAVVPHVLGGDFWVTASSVQCFDFPDPISEDYAGLLARFAPGAEFRRVVFGFATWRSPTGKRGNVAVVGVDGTDIPDDGFVADRSDLKRLNLIAQVSGRLQQASVSDTTLHLAATVDNLPTFLGAPYLIVPFERAHELLRLAPGSTSFLIGRLAAPAPNFDAAIRAASQQFPEVSMIRSKDFEANSSRYWQAKTGAGLAVLLAAVLAGLLMAILLANGVLRFIQRYHHDLVSLLGHGAGTREITQIVAGIASLIAGVTIAAAMGITPFIIRLVAPILPWTSFRFIDALVPMAGVLISLLIAMLASRRAISAYGPEAVFRG